MKKGASEEDLILVEEECEKTTVRTRGLFEKKFTEKLEEVEAALMTIQDDENLKARNNILKHEYDHEHEHEHDEDFTSIASSLIAAHNKDLTNHNKSILEEKFKQKLQLEEKLRKRREAKILQLKKSNRDLSESEVNNELEQEEILVKSEWKVSERSELALKKTRTTLN